jgi:hypothetical protein
VAWENFISLAQHFTATGDFAPGWPAGGRVATEERFAHAPGDGDRDPMLEPDGEGGFYAVWHIAGEYCVEGCGPEPGLIHVQRRTAGGEISPGWPDTAVTASALEIGAHSAPLVAANGDDGVLITWSSGGIHAQSIGPRGERRWGPDGAQVASPATLATLPQIVTDGRGGAFVFWGDSCDLTTGARIFAQHISADGEPRWAPSGVPISGAYALGGTSAAAVSDGAQGAVVVWLGEREGRRGLFAARVTHGGGLPWGHDVRVCDAVCDPVDFRAVSAPDGSTLVAWLDSRHSPAGDVDAQRLLHNGRLAWGPSGAIVCGAPGTRGPLALAPAGDGGAFIAWGDSRREIELYAMRLDADGSPPPDWAAGGTAVCARPTAEYGVPLVESVQLVAVDDAHAMVTWTDFREIAQYHVDDDQTFAMLLGPDGPAASPAGAAIARGPMRPATRAETSGAPAFSLDGTTPDPAYRGARVRFVLPDASPAELVLFDVSGRRLWTHVVGDLGPGEHAVPLSDGAWLPSGLYFIQLAQGERRATTRVAVVH